MNILIIPNTYPNSYNKDSGIFFKEHAELLPSKGIKTIVLAVVPIYYMQIIKSRKLQFGLKIIKENDNFIVYHCQYPAFPRYAYINQFIKKLIGEYIAKKILKIYKIDICHVHTFLAGDIAIWIKKKYKIPFITTEHSSIFYYTVLKKWQNKLALKTFSQSSYNIAVSEKFCELLQNKYKIEFMYLPNPVKIDFFVPSYKQKDEFIFINIAHFKKLKRQELLINSFKILCENINNIKLIIIGKGDEESNLRKLVSSLELNDKVNIYSNIERSLLKELLQNSDCFVFPSIFETFGVALIEALSCGLPVISTKNGGPESIIKDENVGILCENNNIDSLTEAMKYIYNNKFKYKKDYIREYAIKNFSSNVISEKISNIYKKILVNMELS